MRAAFIYTDREEQKVLWRLVKALIEADVAPKETCSIYMILSGERPRHFLDPERYDCGLRAGHYSPHVAFADGKVSAIWVGER